MEKRITKSNALINSSYRLSLNELRIVLYGLSHIDPISDGFPLFYRVNVKELADFFNIGEKDRGSFYDNVKDALVRKFWEREFSYYDDELNEVVKRRWLIEVRYGRKDGTLAYEYNPKIKNHLQQLSKRFTSYFLTNIARMKSAYAVRLYEVAVMNLNASKLNAVTFSKTIEDLKNHLGLAEKYEHFFNFKARVLEKAKKEINKYSDIKFSYEVKKLGRSPNTIEFIVSKKSSNKPPFLAHNQTTKLSTIHTEKAKQIIIESGTGWDVYAIEQQFNEHMKKKGYPKNLEAAFLGFVRKKVVKRP
jgi:plasmid replication initiation protein